VKAGRLRGLAVTTGSEEAVVPEDSGPSAESGVPGFEVLYWFGFFCPHRTPEGV